MLLYHKRNSHLHRVIVKETKTMITIKVFAPPFGDESQLDESGCMTLPDDTVLSDLLKILNISSEMQDAVRISVNRVLADLDTQLKDGDEVSCIMSLPAG